MGIGYWALVIKVYMRCLIQRVKNAQVSVEEKVVGKIGQGIVVFVGFTLGDNQEKINYLADKIVNLRIFPQDPEHHFERSLRETKGEILIVSQFTLYANCDKGRRPAFTQALEPKQAEQLYNQFVQRFQEAGLKVASGQFQALMDVELTNWGPVTISLEK